MHALPRLAQQLLFQLAQQVLWRAHEVADFIAAHLLKSRLGRYAPVHHPHAPGLAVHGLDLLQELRQRGLVRPVPRQHFVRHRQALGGHHQRDDHLAAVGPLVAAVAVPGLGDLLTAPLEVRAGQVVQQHVEAGVEQRLPAFDEELAKLLLVGKDAVQAAVQPVLGRHREAQPQQLVHRAAQEPAAMHRELGHRVTQPIHRQDLKHLGPRHAAAIAPQFAVPERAQPQLIPHPATQPAVAEGARRNRRISASRRDSALT